MQRNSRTGDPPGPPWWGSRATGPRNWRRSHWSRGRTECSTSVSLVEATMGTSPSSRRWCLPTPGGWSTGDRQSSLHRSVLAPLYSSSPEIINSPGPDMIMISPSPEIINSFAPEMINSPGPERINSPGPEITNIFPSTETINSPDTWDYRLSRSWYNHHFS